MQKLKAFTLMELLIGMIISSILISFCYATYSIIYKQFLNYKSIKQEVVQAMQLNTTLTSDFTNAKILTYDGVKLIITNKNNSLIEYRFDEHSILRQKEELIDTFKLKPTEILATYVTESSEQTSTMVNSFSFNATILNEEEHFHFIKVYSAEIAVNKFLQTIQNN